jgi:hypothetical protein
MTGSVAPFDWNPVVTDDAAGRLLAAAGSLPAGTPVVRCETGGRAGVVP